MDKTLNTFTAIAGVHQSFFRCLLAATTTLYLSFIFLVAPLKLGLLVDGAGVGFYPLSLIEWIFTPWPSCIAPVLTGVGLILALMTNPNGVRSIFRPTRHLSLPIVGVLIVAVVASFRSTEEHHSTLFLWHLFAVVNFVFAVLIHLRQVPRARELFIACIAAGTLMTVVSGYHQMFFGFAETKLLALQLAAEQGRSLSVEMLDRLNQTRVYGTFTYPNNYAAHLLLTIPITIYAIVRVASCFGSSKSVIIAAACIATVATCGVLLATGSRGAAVAAVTSPILLLLGVGRRGKNRFQLHRRTVALSLVFGIAVVLIFLFMTSRDRSLSSIGSRADYYTTAFRIFLKHPVFGAGLGEFFPWYLRLKPPGAEETRLTHNFLLSFLSQCGIIGGVAALYYLLQPLLLSRQLISNRIHHVTPGLFLTGIFGVFAWNIHSLLDFNLHIPGTFLIAASMPLLLIDLDIPAESPPPETGRVIPIIILTLSALIGIAGLSRMRGEKSFQMLYYKAQHGTVADALTEDARQAGALSPFSPYPWGLLGRVALSQGNYNLAAQAFDEAVKRTPHRAAYHAYRAQSLLGTGNRDAAAASILEAVKWYPTNEVYQRIQTQINRSELPANH